MMTPRLRTSGWVLGAATIRSVFLLLSLSRLTPWLPGAGWELDALMKTSWCLVD